MMTIPQQKIEGRLRNRNRGSKRNFFAYFICINVAKYNRCISSRYPTAYHKMASTHGADRIRLTPHMAAANHCSGWCALETTDHPRPPFPCPLCPHRFFLPPHPTCMVLPPPRTAPGQWMCPHMCLRITMVPHTQYFARLHRMPFAASTSRVRPAPSRTVAPGFRRTQVGS